MPNSRPGGRLGFHCSISSLHTDNLSFIGTKRAYKTTLTEWSKVSNSHYHSVKIRTLSVH